MTAVPVSVVVVSRGRPQHLARCLTGVAQLFYHPFELVLVTDDAGMSVAEGLGLSSAIKTVPFADDNISAARNAGIANAAGDLIAFLDDDAVPEPTWLDYLAGAVASKRAAAAGGYVIGRNGISFQWEGRFVDGAGDHHAIAETGTSAFVPQPPAGMATRTEGTNMVFRAETLRQIGGFDQGYRFYMEDADLNMRLARAGYATAIAPRAQVHHAFAGSAVRRSNRAPSDLTEIGASVRRFLTMYCPPDAQTAALAHHRAEQHRRCLKHMVAGTMEPRDVARRLAEFDAGSGREQPAPALPTFADPPSAFLPMHKGTSRKVHTVVAGRFFERVRLMLEAQSHRRAGDVVTVLRFSPTALFHKVQFDSSGIWVQTGGVFGRSIRKAPVFRLVTFGKRVREEAARVAPVREPAKMSV